MTPDEVKAAVRVKLQPRLTKEKEAEAIDIVVDFIAGNIGDDFPDWTSVLTFQTDGTDAGRNCKYYSGDGTRRLWQTLVDNNIDHQPPTDPEITFDSYWIEISAAGSSTAQSIFKARPVKAASTEALGVAYTSIDGGNELEADDDDIFPTIDGVTININEDILLKDESDFSLNGIWRLVQPGIPLGPLPGIKWRLRRRADAYPSSAEGSMFASSFVYVKSESTSDQTPNQNAGKLFKAMDSVQSAWHEYFHEFIYHDGTLPSITPGDVMRHNMTKVSAATHDPYAVFVKYLGSGYHLHRRSGFLNGIFTGLTIGTKYYVQSDGTLGTTATRWLMGVAVRTDSIHIQILRGPIDDDAMTENSALFPASQKSSKAYTDAQILATVQGLKWKEPVRAATTGNITLSAAQTIDGVSVIAGDRVLVKDQSTATQNGIYVCAAGAWSRSADADSAADLQSATVPVNEGTANADTTWRQSTDSITLGSSNIVWATFGSSVPDASDSVKGKVQLATLAEVESGTGADKAVTSDKLWATVDGPTLRGTFTLNLFGGSGFSVPVDSITQLEVIISGVRQTTAADGYSARILVTLLNDAGTHSIVGTNDSYIAGSGAASGVTVTVVVSGGGTALDLAIGGHAASYKTTIKVRVISQTTV